MAATNYRLEMDCTHDHLNKTMTCSWLDGRLRIVVDYKAKKLGTIRDGNVIATCDLEGLSIEEFMMIQEFCQTAAAVLSLFDVPSV